MKARLQEEVRLVEIAQGTRVRYTEMGVFSAVAGKVHGQQQLARDLEVERAVMGQRCRPQSFGEVQRCLYSSSSTSNERTEEMGPFLWLIDF